MIAADGTELAVSRSAVAPFGSLAVMHEEVVEAVVEVIRQFQQSVLTVQLLRKVVVMRIVCPSLRLVLPLAQSVHPLRCLQPPIK